MKKSKILCLDLSMGRTGYSIFYGKKIIEYDVIDTKKIKEKASNIHSESLLYIYNKLNEIKSQHEIDLVIIEDGFVRHNKSSKTLAKARAMAELVFHDKMIVLYSVKLIKKAITGNGNASKDDMIQEINKLYNLELIDDNIADSIGLGHYYLNKEKEVE